MEIELTKVDSSTHQRKIVLDRLPVMIGQGPESSVRLDDHWVSRHHCEINSVRGTLVVRDLGSVLGTFVNGLNVTTALLMPGDKLTVGITSFMVDYERRHAGRSASPRSRAARPLEPEVAQPASDVPAPAEAAPAEAAPRRSQRRFFRRLWARLFSIVGRKRAAQA
jgi:pSer/pThr/pTyr-binding forkhead associated (FHA) protein